MNLNDFRYSRWAKKASKPGALTKVMQQLPRWFVKVQNQGVVDKALALVDHLISGMCPPGDIVLIVAGLLYLMTPCDAVPDYLPVVGWLDDLTVASLILTYLDEKSIRNRLKRNKIGF
jgi:uncharacterized membrane protein YkvA (DUF1232 family)